MDKEKFDPTKHILVPQHIKLSEEETEQILKAYNISFKQLPLINKNDPTIKDMDVKPGDIIKIIRKNTVTGESIFYRGVC